MTHLYQKLDALAAGELRYRSNDSTAYLNGEVTYAGDPPSYGPVAVENYVGLVDENCGGMIAYGPPDVIDRLAADLNLLDVVERLFKSEPQG